MTASFLDSGDGRDYVRLRRARNTTNEYTSVIEQNVVCTDRLGRLWLSLQRACASDCQIRLTGADT